MKTQINKNKSEKREQGVVIIIVALCLVLLVGVAALAIDIGYLYTARTELQRVSDAAALAGARYMGEVYSGLETQEASNFYIPKEDVFAAINDVAKQNKAGNESISIGIEDLRLGRWDPYKSDTDLYMETLFGPDAVSVVARRDDSANGPLGTFLARVFGIQTINVTSNKSIAALTGPSYVDEGDLVTPFAISALNKCTKPKITFYPSNSCGGWHNFLWPVNASDLDTFALGIIKRHISNVDGMVDGEKWLKDNWEKLNMDKLDSDLDKLFKDLSLVEIYETGDYFNFQQGPISSMFNGSYLIPATYNGNIGKLEGTPEHSPAPIFALFDFFRYRDSDGDDSKWTAKVPVYEETGECSATNKKMRIVGFAVVEIKMPKGPPDSNIEALLHCDLIVDEGRGGGTTYGALKGKIPNLVR
jgi:hypothetical protein